ncbi:MAG: hypothetical protein FJW80_10440 [Actinobacteria bacterium]|nr:hypothetical protein [Actinomycetota bacterium]
MAARDKRTGVRGPRGPQGAGPSSQPALKPAPSAEDPTVFQRISLPLLTRLTRLPKWLIAVVLSALMVLGMIQTGSLAWLGALILGLLTVFFLWLLVLSWPAVPASGRMLRGIVVVALAGGAVLKAMGRL